MTDASPQTVRILLVEDDEIMARSTADAIQRRAVSTSGHRARVDVAVKFEDAMDLIAERRYDLIILDIRDQASVDNATSSNQSEPDDATEADKGLIIYEAVRRRRFLPIIFYSAVAHLAAHHDNPPFVSVVSKLAEEDNALRQAVIAVFDSPLPGLIRAVAAHVDETLRKFMIEFVENHWLQLAEPFSHDDLAYLMTRRLARSLDETFVAELAGHGPAAAGDKVHPMRMYVVPPTGVLAVGDIVRDATGRRAIVLTPTCDLVIRADARPKADRVLVAECLPLSGMQECADWIGSASVANQKKLDALIANNGRQKDRYYYLPAAWGVPDLLADLQLLRSVPFDEFDQIFTRECSLDEPYAQSLTAQLGRFVGRIGTPDIDPEIVRARIQVDFQAKEDGC